jgi:hypothetical protein
VLLDAPRLHPGECAIIAFCTGGTGKSDDIEIYLGGLVILLTTITLTPHTCTRLRETRTALS